LLRVVRRMVEKFDLYDLDVTTMQKTPTITTAQVTNMPVPYATYKLRGLYEYSF
jgi:hypothetical protein